MKNGADPDPKAVNSDPKAVIPYPIYVATILLFSCFVQVKTLNLLYNVLQLTNLIRKGKLNVFK